SSRELKRGIPWCNGEVGPRPRVRRHAAAFTVPCDGTSSCKQGTCGASPHPLAEKAASPMARFARCRGPRRATPVGSVTVPETIVPEGWKASGHSAALTSTRPQQSAEETFVEPLFSVTDREWLPQPSHGLAHVRFGLGVAEGLDEAGGVVGGAVVGAHGW